MANLSPSEGHHVHRYVAHREFRWQPGPPNEAIQAMPLLGWQLVREWRQCECGAVEPDAPKRFTRVRCIKIHKPVGDLMRQIIIVDAADLLEVREVQEALHNYFSGTRVYQGEDRA